MLHFLIYNKKGQLHPSESDVACGSSLVSGDDVQAGPGNTWTDFIPAVDFHPFLRFIQSQPGVDETFFQGVVYCHGTKSVFYGCDLSADELII